jgi:hypothetical protein
MATVRKRIGKIKQLRRAGANVVDYVGTALVPAVTYGADVHGFSDTTLSEARRLAAQALAPPTAGKNPELVLHAMVPTRKTVDPAYAAHVVPARQWAFACWEGWVDRGKMQRAFDKAKCKLADASSSGWARVNGPAAAFINTMKRIEWECLSPFLLVDDTGYQWDTLKDSPTAIAQAVSRSVDRWKLDRVLKIVPSAKPDSSDVQVDLFSSAADTVQFVPGGMKTVIIDVSSKLRALHKCTNAVTMMVPEWSQQCRQSLYSATTNGQWPQVRRAKLPGFVGNDLCQLCYNSKGTTDHRLQCPVTTPANGWTRRPRAAEMLWSKINVNRRRALQTQAVMAVRAPVPVSQEENGWVWWPGQPDHDDTDLLWVFDGSCKYAAQWHLARTGCGVVVMSRRGDFVACAAATPPSWIKKSSEAETWALYLILRDAISPPRMLTDCMSLIQTASRGTRYATAGRNSAARVWGLIAEALDGSITQLCHNNRLNWLPAHKSLTAAISRQKSDGSPVKAWEWRANALADALAKFGAPDCAVAKKACEVIKSAGAALQHSAAILGAATHAANNWRVEATLADGSTQVTILRDTSEKPVWTSSNVDTAAAPCAQQQQLPQPPQAEPYALPPPQLQQQQQARPQLAVTKRNDAQPVHCAATSRRLAAKEAERRRAEADNTATELAVARITASCNSTAGPSASERMAALTARLLAKSTS